MLKIMLKVIQKSKIKLLGLSLTFITGLSLYGCDANTSSPSQTATEQTQPAQIVDISQLENGNILYIIRDAANMQLKTGEYLAQLQKSQTALQQAISAQDQPLLKQSVEALTTQLTALNSALNGLNLKSQEVEKIRQQVLEVSQQALAMPVFNGQVDLSKVDFSQIEQQLGLIQADMLQLAALVISNADTETSNSDTDEKAEK